MNLPQGTSRICIDGCGSNFCAVYYHCDVATTKRDYSSVGLRLRTAENLISYTE